MVLSFLSREAAVEQLLTYLVEYFDGLPPGLHIGESPVDLLIVGVSMQGLVRHARYGHAIRGTARKIDAVRRAVDVDPDRLQLRAGLSRFAQSGGGIRGRSRAEWNDVVGSGPGRLLQPRRCMFSP